MICPLVSACVCGVHALMNVSLCVRSSPCLVHVRLRNLSVLVCETNGCMCVCVCVCVCVCLSLWEQALRWISGASTLQAVRDYLQELEQLHARFVVIQRVLLLDLQDSNHRLGLTRISSRKERSPTEPGSFTRE
mgnify:CR=1 FL=1